jgi:hypothetical protein
MFGKIRGGLKIAALVGLAAASVTFAPTAPATAATGCGGQVIDKIYHGDQQTPASEVVAISYLYWDGTYNCVKTVKKKYVGTPSRMWLWICNDAGACSRNDEGYFKYYAGPVSVYGRNHCIYFEADGWAPDGHEMYQDRVPVNGYFHCD